MQGNNTLVIRDAQPVDGGAYTCTASNGYGVASDAATISVEDVTVSDVCQDNPNFANCRLIVRAQYCGNQYYAKFCCRSCTLAGQI